MQTIHGLAVAAVAAVTIGFGCQEAGERYVLVSGGQTGVYYPAAQSIARVVRMVNPELRIDVRPSGGSVTNAREIGRGGADFALIQNDIAAYAAEGRYMFEGGRVENIRGLAALYPEHVQIVVRADAGIESVADLAGRRVSVGDRGSGTEANATQVLEAAGLSIDDLERAERLGAGQSREYLQDGRIDAAFFTFGVGTAAIQELALMTEIDFVAIDGDVRDQLLEQYPFYAEDVIPAGAYRDEENGAPVPASDVPTVTVTATLVARGDVPDEAVGTVLRGIFENLESFQQAHGRLRQVNRDDAETNLTVPMHAGAEAFYAGETLGEAAAQAALPWAPEQVVLTANDANRDSPVSTGENEPAKEAADCTACSCSR